MFLVFILFFLPTHYLFSTLNMTPFEFAEFLDDIREYKIQVDKGQRIFRPKDSSFDTDPAYDEVKKHEVYISNLPHDCFENELLPFLSRAGPVYVIRTIMNFSGSTKGMVFVIFSRVEDAFEAVEKLDGEYIRSSGNGCERRVRVSFSVNNRRLLLRNIPEKKTEEDLLRELEAILNGVKSVKIFRLNEGNNAMVLFESHQMASYARRLLVPKGSPVRIFGEKLEAEWAKPKDFKTLFARFNCSFFNQSALKDFFEQKFSIGKPVTVTSVNIQGRNAFVKFRSFSEANHVLKQARLMPETDFFVNNFLEIEDLSWPSRR